MEDIFSNFLEDLIKTAEYNNNYFTNINYSNEVNHGKKRGFLLDRK